MGSLKVEVVKSTRGSTVGNNPEEAISERENYPAISGTVNEAETLIFS
jgi:hypothetical protein